MSQGNTKIRGSGAKFMCGLAVALAVSSTHGQTELAKLTASDGVGGDNFGNAVCVDGSYAIVGSMFEGPPASAGAAYIYRDIGSGWQQMQKLVELPTRTANDQYGVSVGISGDIAVVGAWQDVNTDSVTLGLGQTGAAFVYRRNDNGTPGNLNDDVWIQEAKLTASDRRLTDHFGIAVSIDGNVIAIGADQADKPGLPNVGAVYVYRHNGISWIEEAKLQAADADNFDSFADAIALDGDVIIAGERGNDDAGTNSGSAYVFEYSGLTWSQTAKFSAFDAASLDNYGSSVAVSGSVAVVGSRLDDNFVADTGSAYVYRKTGSVWGFEQKLIPSAAGGNEQFGAGVAVRGNTIAAGAPLQFDIGTISLYHFDGSVWNESPSQILASDGDSGDQFGNDVSICSGSSVLLIAGAVGNSDPGPGAGSAYTFEISSAPVDSDGDGLSDADEAIQGTNPNDPDSDDDGLFDGLEVEIAAGGPCPSPLNSDTDGDGLSDSHENSFGPNTCNADVDNDGLLDGEEVAAGTNFNDFDSDDDGVSDGNEVHVHGSNPLNTDTDGDGLQDGMEVAFATSLTIADTDGDGLTDGAEVTAAAGSGCPNPLLQDSDGDGLIDGVESGFGTGACNSDTDGDGLSDGSESGFGTSPTDADSDDDDLLDGHEVMLAAGGGCPSPTNGDSDSDGISDGNELTGGLGPCDADSDNDGLADGNEATFGTNPLDSDTDNDGMLDGAEVDVANGGSCPNPLVADSDNDTISDGGELAAGSSPCNVDTDNDGIGDAIDPTPTTPGIPANFVANMTQATAGGMLMLPSAEFLGPNNNVRIARRTVMAAELLLASFLIDNGNYNAARALLTVVERRIDGQSPPPDWMPIDNLDTPGNPRQMLHEDVETLLILVDFLN